MPEFINPNDIFIWSSYLATAVVLVGLGVVSWRTKTKDLTTLRKLEKHMRDSAEK